MDVCRFNLFSLLWSEAMAFAIDEINREQLILPNITLGFQIFDTCLSLPKVLQGTMWMLTGQAVPILNFRCQSHAPVVAIVGDPSSAPTIPMARLLGLYRYPQVSYFATSPLLKDKLQFPSFLRTVPSDEFQVTVIAQLAVHFGWTWVGLLSTDNDYGEIGSHFMTKELIQCGICIAYHKVIPVVFSDKRINEIIDTVKISTAKVVIVYGSEPYITPVLSGLANINEKGMMWIAVDSWSQSVTLVTKAFADMLSGTLGLAMNQGLLPGFPEFLIKIHPSRSPNNIFAKPLFELAFGCQWPSLDKNESMLTNVQDTRAICSGLEDLDMSTNPYLHDPDLRINYSVYKAVHVVVYALRDMAACVAGDGPFRNRTCADVKTFQSWQLLHYMKKVRFWSKAGEEIYFDQNGDPPATYDIINWQIKEDGTLQHVKVGHFDSRLSKGQQLYINKSAIHWNMQGTEVPLSVCSESCTPGYRKALQEGRPACCYDCIPCAEGEIANETDSTTCWKCPEDQWPNEGRSKCVLKRIEFLSYEEPLGITLTTTASFSSFTAAVILCVFIRYRETAIVKANNREHSYLLLATLLLSFLCSLLFIGEPQPTTCMLRQLTFGVIYVLCVSCVLAKTIMVVIAFNATKPGSKMRKWLGPRVPVATVFGCTLLQVIICATWLLLCPPFPEKNITLKTWTVILQCNECSQTAFWCMLGYMGLLACVSFLVAFLSRALPDSFNEAKWITFSMLVFLSVWLSFIPAYVSTQGKYTVAVESFAIISSSAGLLFCIFIPKCYIILLRPELNTREHLLVFEKKVLKEIECLEQKGIPRNSNLSQKEILLLRNLGNNNGIVIRQANKGGAIVILDKQDYMAECERVLSDNISYRKVDRDPNPTLHKMIKEKVEKAVELEWISKQEGEYLARESARTLVFYILPKIHKSLEKPPGRPTVSGVNSLLEPLSKFVDVYLRSFVMKMRSYVQDIRDAISKIEGLPFNPSTDVLICLDIQSLYTNIPQRATLEVIEETLLLREDNHPVLRLRMESVMLRCQDEDFSFLEDVKNVSVIATEMDFAELSAVEYRKAPPKKIGIYRLKQMAPYL
ncbi:vomeronasal type-2 receptor 1-like [Ambystoma mexicanum]|uniref:vomeronasal type-2 receptor 1-like n=1 Tax=Ambystoma mexicanum TaxID=8296 RepID=UPI0037E77705